MSLLDSIQASLDTFALQGQQVSRERRYLDPERHGHAGGSSAWKLKAAEQGSRLAAAKTGKAAAAAGKSANTVRVTLNSAEKGGQAFWGLNFCILFIYVSVLIRVYGL